jgi:hypothetical protein
MRAGTGPRSRPTPKSAATSDASSRIPPRPT